MKVPLTDWASKMLRLVSFRRQPWSVLFMPVAVALWPLVAFDYRQRRIGAHQDRWYWADVLLYRIGYAVDAKLAG